MGWESFVFCFFVFNTMFLGFRGLERGGVFKR